MLDRVNRMKCGMHSVIIIFETACFNVYLRNNENKKNKNKHKKKLIDKSVKRPVDLFVHKLLYSWIKKMKFSNNFLTWKIIYMNKALSASYVNTCIYVIYISYTC